MTIGGESLKWERAGCLNRAYCGPWLYVIKPAPRSSQDETGKTLEVVAYYRTDRGITLRDLEPVDNERQAKRWAARHLAGNPFERTIKFPSPRKHNGAKKRTGMGKAAVQSRDRHGR